MTELDDRITIVRNLTVQTRLGRIPWHISEHGTGNRVARLENRGWAGWHLTLRENGKAMELQLSRDNMGDVTSFTVGATTEREGVEVWLLSGAVEDHLHDGDSYQRPAFLAELLNITDPLPQPAAS